MAAAYAAGPGASTSAGVGGAVTQGAQEFGTALEPTGRVGGPDLASQTLEQEHEAALASTRQTDSSLIQSRLRHIEDGGESCREEVDLSLHAVGDEGIRQVCRGLASSEVLKRLVLQSAGIGPEGFSLLGPLLANCPALESLVLSGNDCGPSGLRGGFADGLRKSRSIRSLALAGCSLRDDGVSPICDVLAFLGDSIAPPTKLEELSLSSNRLGPVGTKRLSDALAPNLFVQSLDLSANSLGPEGATELATGLRANKGRIRKVNVSQNGIKVDGARPLIDLFMLPEISFTIHLVQLPYSVEEVGVMLDSTTKVVTGVFFRSLLDKFNKANPADAVCVGDIVADVNGQTGVEEILELLAPGAGSATGKDLTITLVRRGVGLTYLDLCHNGLTQAGLAELREEIGKPMSGSLPGWVIRFDGGARQLLVNAMGCVTLPV